MDGWAQRWLNDPERWHSHPIASDAGVAAAVVVLAVLGIAFWLKGRYWP